MSVSGSNSSRARDIAYHLHPATDARLHEKIGPLVITKGKGVNVWDEDGREYIEGLAGLWSVAVGFGEERLVSAATRQMEQLPYYHSFGHKSHPSVIDLAEKLATMSPVEGGKVFFANSGSEANDTAIKIVWYVNNAKGLPKKTKFISRKLAYHGITIGAGSLTGTPWNHRGFNLPLSNFLHVSCPHYRPADAESSEEVFADHLADELEQLILAEGPETIAAFIGEPVMAAGGVYVPPATYWAKIQAVLRKYDVYLIADEVITGFGRTGKTFGCETFGIKPDMMVLSKQLTSSYMPLSALVVSDEIYQRLADQSHAFGAFAHGFTGSGHPVAMAVALENLAILEESDLVGNAARLSPYFQERLRSFLGHPLVAEARGCGLIGAIALATVPENGEQTPPGLLGRLLNDACLNRGLIVRAIGDAIAFCPPLIITRDEIDEMFRRFGRALHDVHQNSTWRSVTVAATSPK
ncbi:MAG: aspartate aminotransferase family protein [Proteobacteria bacterium]|nr:aspartate aminotransferase family protein [Pseudomonadota bacterium]